MNRRNRSSSRPVEFFKAPANDSIGKIAAAFGNIGVDIGLSTFSQYLKKCAAARVPDPERQHQAGIWELERQKQMAETAKAEAQRAKAEEQLRITQLKLDELEKAKLESMAYTVKKTEMDLHIHSEVISGSLELSPNPDSFSGNGNIDQQIAAREWIDEFKKGKVAIVTGKRNSGKTSCAARLAETVMGVHHIQCYWLLLPKSERDRVPHWVHIVERLDQVPNNSLILCDEGGLGFLSLRFQSEKNVYLRKMMMVCRHKHCSLIFAVQNTRDLDLAVVRQTDTLIIREPGLQQAETERPEVSKKITRAAAAFGGIPKAERIKYAYIIDSVFEGLVLVGLPTFWSEELSEAYADVDLHESDEPGRSTMHDDSHSNETDEDAGDDLYERILELRAQGFGIEKIAKTIPCPIWTVRKCLEANK